MRRIVGIVALVAVVALVVVLLVVSGVFSGGGDTGYKVRAEFRNAFALTKDTEVRVAGAPVGTVETLGIGANRNAVVILDISDPGFQDFRRDATCVIRPQSLIGERFVDCRLTKPRMSGGSAPPPPLKTIDVDGQTQHVLPVANTGSPIDLDLLFNINRLPQRQRFRIILSELGTGLAGRGSDIRGAVRNAAPALKDTQEVLKLLAANNSQLNRLATDGNRSLQPLVRERDSLLRFVRRAGNVAQATSEQSPALRENLRLLPGTLDQIAPTMRELDRLSTIATPALRDISASAPATADLLRALRPFSQAAIGPVKDLGETTEIGRRALIRSQPTIRQLSAVSSRLQPVARDLREILVSADQNTVLENFARYTYYQAIAINGYDGVSHYLRARLIADSVECARYSVVEVPECSAKFGSGGGAAARARRVTTRSATVPGSSGTLEQRVRTEVHRRVAGGQDIDQVLADLAETEEYRKVLDAIREQFDGDRRKRGDADRKPGESTSSDEQAIQPPSSLLPGDQGSAASRRGGAAAGGRDPQQAAQDGVVDYLLGDGS